MSFAAGVRRISCESGDDQQNTSFNLHSRSITRPPPITPLAAFVVLVFGLTTCSAPASTRSLDDLDPAGLLLG